MCEAPLLGDADSIGYKDSIGYIILYYIVGFTVRCHGSGVSLLICHLHFIYCLGA